MKLFLCIRRINVCSLRLSAVLYHLSHILWRLLHFLLNTDQITYLNNPKNMVKTMVLLTRLSFCNTQARAVNLIPAILCNDEGVIQARGCQRHETGRGVERWHCTIYCLEFCAGFNDAERQHLSTINTNSDLSFTTIQQQTYRRKQLMGQADDNLLTALLTKKRSSKVPRGRKYMHRKANRKTHSANGVNIESRVT